MSQTLTKELSSWKVLESQIRGTVVQRSGIPLSKRDTEVYLTSILLQGQILADLLISRSPNRRPRIIRWCKNLVHEDVLLVSSLIKALGIFIRNYTLVDGPLSYNDFKRRYNDDYSFVGDFLSPIKEEMEDFLNLPTPATFTIINQHLSFISRLSLRDIDLQAESLDRYRETERRLANSTYCTHTLTILNKIMREWTESFSYEEFLPSHGNGSIAERSGTSTIKDKYLLVSSDTRLDYFLRSLGTIDTYRPRPVSHQLSRTCRVQCVAKSIQSLRVISMEPASLQYFQHGVSRSIDRWISRHETLKHRIHIHEASRNRDLAETGSRDRSYATIDLSDASDSVSWRLVKAIFAGTPLLRALYCTRSDDVLLPDEEVIHLQKFAPMGSALCFPIECLVFAVICEYVLRFSGLHYKGIPYLVHGDDIVIRTEIASDVVELLTELNFIVNQEKSFIARDLPFRESCGGEFFFGVDVTPVRLSRKFCSDLPGRYHPQMYPHYVKMANTLSSHNFRLARLWFIHKLLSLPQPFMPLFGDNESLVNSVTCTNFHLIRKYKKDWQCDMLKCGTTQVVYTDSASDGDDDIRYFEWLRATSTRLCGPKDPEDLVAVHLTPPTLKLVSRFVSNS